MNCIHAKELLPLFITGDLSAADMNAVGEHARRCESCRAQTAEITAARDWLKQAANPALDEDFYDHMRAGVWDRIDAEANRPRWWSFILPVWTSRPVLAMAAAVLLAVFGLIAISDRKNVSTRPVPPQDVTAELSAPAPEPFATADQRVAPQYKRRVKPEPAAPRIVVPAPAAPISPLGDMAEAASDAESIEESGMIRIEIQTADPNIKIIWLAPKPAAAKSDPIISTTE
ncbi:MAG: zf-HC2 domain-containing protein [Acidobacteria bacterium]|nr:zf-HC2 domain-containing protein [Acidobacteriota bacterium]MCW5969454.1 zf-HC2 domain-containing protein [Blastocatellales bacterium]